MPIDFSDLDPDNAGNEQALPPLNVNPGGVMPMNLPQDATEAAGLELRDSLVDMAGNTSAVAGDLAANALAGPVAGARTIPEIPKLLAGSSGPVDAFSSIMGTYRNALEAEKTRQPAAALANVPPMFDAAQVMGLLPGQTRQNYIDERFERVLGFPNATSMGGAAADALAVLAWRSPRQIAANRRGVLPEQMFRSTAAPPIRKGELIDLFKPSTYRATEWGKVLAREGIRVGEVGLDGALIAALNDDDPISGLMIGAGMQAGGSALLSMSGIRKASELSPSGLLKGGVILGINSLMAANIIQTLKTVVPGGNDFILPSIESGYQKAVALAGLGVMAGLAGSGRVGQNILRNQGPVLADAITGLPRSSILSLWRDLHENPESKSFAVIQELAKDGNVFGATVNRRLTRAFEQGDDIPQAIEAAMEADPSFKRAVNELKTVTLADLDPIAAADRTAQNMPSAPEFGDFPAPDVPGAQEPNRRQFRSSPGEPKAAEGEQMPTSNPLGVPQELIGLAERNAATTSPEEAFSNADKEMAKITRDRILAELDGGEMPAAMKKQIRELLKDRDSVTPDTLRQVQALLGQ